MLNKSSSKKLINRSVHGMKGIVILIVFGIVGLSLLAFLLTQSTSSLYDTRSSAYVNLAPSRCKEGYVCTPRNTSTYQGSRCGGIGIPQEFGACTINGQDGECCLYPTSTPIKQPNGCSFGYECVERYVGPLNIAACRGGRGTLQTEVAGCDYSGKPGECCKFPTPPPALPAANLVAPSGFRYQCMGNSILTNREVMTDVTLRWDGATGANQYALGLDDKTNGFSSDCANPYVGDVCNKIVGDVQTHTFRIAKNGQRQYWAWVLSGKSSTSGWSWSAPSNILVFSCP